MNIPLQNPAASIEDHSLPPLYAPRLSKLAAMSITTLGFYLIYWGYKNWQIMKEAGRTTALAPLCGFFLPVTLFSLIDKTSRERENLGISGIAQVSAAIFFLLLGFLKIIPIVGILTGMISFIPLIPINSAFAKINAANQQRNPAYENFTLVNKIWLLAFVVWLGCHLTLAFIAKS